MIMVRVLTWMFTERKRDLIYKDPDPTFIYSMVR